MPPCLPRWREHPELVAPVPGLLGPLCGAPSCTVREMIRHRTPHTSNLIRGILSGRSFPEVVRDGLAPPDAGWTPAGPEGKMAGPGPIDGTSTIPRSPRSEAAMRSSSPIPRRVPHLSTSSRPGGRRRTIPRPVLARLRGPPGPWPGRASSPSPRSPPAQRPFRALAVGIGEDYASNRRTPRPRAGTSTPADAPGRRC